jgi:hypothetical protein
MKDGAVRRRPAEREALIAGGVRAFCLTNAQLRGDEQARRFTANLDRLLRQAVRPGPYIYGVYEDRLQLLWPRERY